MLRTPPSQPRYVSNGQPTPVTPLLASSNPGMMATSTPSPIYLTSSSNSMLPIQHHEPALDQRSNSTRPQQRTTLDLLYQLFPELSHRRLQLISETYGDNKIMAIENALALRRAQEDCLSPLMSYQQLIKPNMLSTDALMLQSLSQLASSTQFSPQIMVAPQPQHVSEDRPLTQFPTSLAQAPLQAPHVTVPKPKLSFSIQAIIESGSGNLPDIQRKSPDSTSVSSSFRPVTGNRQST